MKRKVKVKRLKQALELQGIELTKSVASRIVDTYDKLLIKKGKFNIKDISKIEIAIEKEFPKENSVTYTYESDASEGVLTKYKDALHYKLLNRRATIIRRELNTININSMATVGNYVITKRLLILTEEEKQKIISSKQGELSFRPYSKYCIWENVTNYSDEMISFFATYYKTMHELIPDKNE